MNKTIWKQADSRWGGKPYPTRDCTMSGAGCGCVACAHIAMEQDRYANWTPEALRPWMVSQGFAIRNQGTTYSGMTKTLQHVGHSNVVVVGTADPMTKAWTELKKGNRIGIILFRGGSYNGVRWTNSGHYVAFTDYKIESNKHYFYCKDSGGRNHDGWYSYENSMRGLVYMMWIVEKINPKETKVATTTTTNGKLTVDGFGGKATVTRLQEFLGVTKTGGITIAKTSYKYCKSLKAIEYGNGGSNTVRALQKWLGIKQDGDWGPATSKALQKKLGVTQDGYFGPNSMKALQKYLNTNSKAVYPAPTKQDKICSWAKSICDSGKYSYKVFGDDPKTQQCPICHPGSGNGWNCIGYAIATWKHGGGINCRCNCEVINDSMGNRLLRSNHDTALSLVKQCLGVNDVQLISNGGKEIPTSSLKKGDIILYYEGSEYTHMATYVGNGMITDSSRGHKPQVMYGFAYHSPSSYGICKLAIRYTGK